jgi:hypothetical protein
LWKCTVVPIPVRRHSRKVEIDESRYGQQERVPDN